MPRTKVCYYIFIINISELYMHKKIGRPTLKNSPLSNKEKKLRYNTRAAIKLKVAESRGFVPITSLISKVHLLAMTEAYEFKLDDDDIVGAD